MCYICNWKNHYFINYKDEKIKNKLKEFDVNQVFIDLMLHMNHFKILKKDKLLMNTSNHWEKIIINSYILVTSIKSTHEELYAICIKWTKFSEIENHSQFIQLFYAVETVSFETMYQICSRWLHVKEWVF